MKHILKVAIAVCMLHVSTAYGQIRNPKFTWPEGKRMALSLSFDDARKTNVRQGTDLFDRYGVKATFYVLPSTVKPDLALWQKAAKNGHEMGNHSIVHPCSGNFVWSRDRALETYTIEKMRTELQNASKEVEALLGVKPTTYAYPCGLTTLGRGKDAKSFVPVIAELFTVGRGWLDEAPVDPTYCDLAQVTGVSMDDKTFEQLLPMIQQTQAAGHWLVLAGHETDNVPGPQTTRLEMLEALIQYAKDPKNGIWIAPVGEIAAYVQEQRIKELVNTPQPIVAKSKQTIQLPAAKATAYGTKIEYMPEWKAFGWFTGNDKVVWEIDLPADGTYEVVLDWSVSDEESGKGFVLEGGVQPLRGKVAKSGSWETFKQQKIGKIQLKKGRQTLTFKPEVAFESGALLDLRSLQLRPL